MNFLPAFLPWALAGLLLLGGPRLAPAQAPTPPPPTQAGYYRLRLGDFLITALSDGSVSVPVSPLLLHIPPAQVKQLLTEQYLSDLPATSVNAYLIDTGTKRLLVDTGSGPFFGPAGGHLLASLRAAGYQPAQIDAVLLTHLHSDHSGGLMQGSQLTFPNATVYAAQAEVDFWLNPANQAKVAAGNRSHFKAAETTVRPVLTAGRLTLFRSDAELFPGVRPLLLTGHTPGHRGYVVESQGQKLVFWGDLLHVAAVQFPRPGVAVTTDEDPAAAIVRRQQAFAAAAQQGYWVAGSHLSFPGIGHVRAAGKQYLWVPINFGYDAQP